MYGAQKSNRLHMEPFTHSAVGGRTGNLIRLGRAEEAIKDLRAMLTETVTALTRIRFCSTRMRVK